MYRNGCVYYLWIKHCRWCYGHGQEFTANNLIKGSVSGRWATKLDHYPVEQKLLCGCVSCELISVSIVKWCYIATEAMFGHSLNNTDHGVAVDFKITFTGWLQRDGHHSLIQITISRMKLRKKKYAPHNGCWTHLAGGEGRSLDAVVSLSQ